MPDASIKWSMPKMAVIPLNVAKRKKDLTNNHHLDMIGDNMKPKKNHPWSKMGQFRNHPEFHACLVCGADTSAYGEICNACNKDYDQDITPFLSEKTASTVHNMQAMHERMAK